MLKALQDSLGASLSGDPWHGPSLDGLLADVTAEEAGARAVPGGHSILEIVLHIGAWLGEVASRLRGNAPAQPAAGDWPSLGGDVATRWAEARARVVAARAELVAALAAFPESRLGERVGGERDAPLGTGFSFETMLMGLAQHNAYHGGQVAILKRALRSRVP
jgi:hypothetical protein